MEVLIGNSSVNLHAYDAKRERAGGFGDRQLNKALGGQDIASTLKWDCLSGRTPDAYPKTLKAETGILFHGNDYATTGKSPPKSELEKRSILVRDKFVADCGFASPEKLDDVLQLMFGVHYPTFDIDTLIAALKPKYCLTIRIKVERKAFTIYQTGQSRLTGRIFLLVPAYLSIEVRRTHECIDGVKVKIPENKRWLTRLYSREVVKPKTPTSKTLRKEAYVQALEQNFGQFLDLKREAEELRAELEQLDPPG